MLFWIFVIPFILCLAFGIFIRVCVVINNNRAQKSWDIDDYDERHSYRKTCTGKLAHKVDGNIAGQWPEVTAWAASAILGIVVLVMGICIIEASISADSIVAANQKRYESLVYQYENNVYDSDDDVIGKKELYNQIQDWNEDLARYKAKEKDFWIGIFYPNVFDQFEFIEYK